MTSMSAERGEVCRCRHCGREWELNCEQHACIELFDECIPCRFTPAGKGSRAGTQADLDLITQKRAELLRMALNDQQENGNG